MTDKNQIKNQTGKIIKGIGGLYTVRLDDGSGDIQCRARGSFRHSHMTPLAGDNVVLQTDDNNKSVVIDEICPRKNSLIRPPLANIDYVFVTMASAKPDPMTDMTDKLLSILEFNHIEPVIIIGKCELDPDKARVLEKIYTGAGFNTFVLSCACDTGISEVKRFIDENLSGKISAFAGASGVGKSTLMNKIFPTLSLDTSNVSRKIERGRHTTRSVTLYEVVQGGGYIADTPGFSMLDFERFDFFDKEDLPYTFREFADCIGKCKYKKCTHIKEEGCAIIEEIRAGRISKSRHGSYVELFNVLKNKHSWDK